jgi:hypothetical protein
MYKPKYKAVSQMKGNKRAGLAHSNSMALQTAPDPNSTKNDAKTGGPKAEVELKRKEPFVYTKHENGKTIETRQSVVDNARAKTGYFKQMPEYKGYLRESDQKDRWTGLPIVFGFKDHDGNYTQNTTSDGGKKLRKRFEYERKLYNKMKAEKDSTTSHFATPVDRVTGLPVE